MKCLLILICFVPLFLKAQTTIEGVVLNQSGKPVFMATIFVKGTTDGAQTDEKGAFKLTTKSTGKQLLVVKGDEIAEQSIEVNLTGKPIVQTIKVQQSRAIEEVVISAGTMSASNDRSVAILDPLDIVTTAGGQGDIAGAIQTLPGVQRNGGDQTGLMVRGGDVSETSFIIDGLIAQNAFGSSVPGVGQRTRFSPFQFKGTAFSTGGYTARYGQALSSVLDLSTLDLPDQTNINIGASFGGINFGGSKLMENSAVEFTGNYSNLTPFLWLSKANIKFYEAPQGFGFSGRYVAKTSTRGMFKMTFNQTYNSSGLEIPNPAVAGTNMRFGLKNQNTYVNTTFKNFISDKWMYYVGFSLSNNDDDINWDSIVSTRNDKRVQGRAELVYSPGNRFKMVIGSELQHFQYRQLYDTLTGQFAEMLSAGYVEADIIPFRNFAIKPGVRVEYSKLIAKGNISPRLAMAIKTSKTSQISLASGYFYQLASPNYLMQGYRPNFQEAMHLMANYQIIAKSRIFRLEGYYKSYSQLIRENGVTYNPNAFRFNYGMVDNSGSGYAQGIDVFWRDKKSIKNFDYWISYSYIDTKRLYQNYISKVTPDYVSDHNLNVVMKYFSTKLQTSFSMTYSYASGRPYYNPSNSQFLRDHSPDYHNLAFTAAYLTTIKKFFTVFYISLDNITNQHNVLGYNYSYDGSQRYEIKPPFYFNIFFGFNMSLKEFNKDEI
ncbi:TonB-dependent receptor [Fluviicola taffensis]|uniref:TonB-dependent receptor plug n=1 Tax=Fluviicola taffensis (strain DSM 16823 / NCIMB 13979 / RW262) TaxID=755732 RepID=F2IHN5_FLUTR|nr:carboxypeptidase-like regulatory domain-containing protein [Fluviicola taffensis]AEA44813.1 TonB-dependent receptor plug [Fluviicola taffensis DSM 16823]